MNDSVAQLEEWWNEWKPGFPIPPGRGQVWRDGTMREFAENSEVRAFDKFPSWEGGSGGTGYPWRRINFYRRVIEPEWQDAFVVEDSSTKDYHDPISFTRTKIQAQIKDGKVIAVRMKK